MKNIKKTSICVVSVLLTTLPWAALQAESEGSAPSESVATDENKERAELPRVYVEGPASTRQDGVTGTKTGTPLIETPQSISVITGDQIREQGADSLAQALRYAPGVYGEPFGFEPRFTLLNLRGFPAYTTGFYRDGLQLRNPGFAVGYNFEPYGFERLDVLRGPASVLYGQGDPGGLVNFISKRPTLQPFHEVELELGSYNRKQVSADFSGPLDDGGDFAYRLTTLVRDSDTQVDFIPNDRIFIAPALTWRPDVDTTVTFLSYYQDDEARSSQALPAEGTLFANPHGKIPLNRFMGEPDVDVYNRVEYSLGYLLEHHASDSLIFRQNLRYYASDLDDVTVYSAALRADMRTLDRYVFGSFGDLGGIALDNQAQYTFMTGSMEHVLLVGIDYQNIDVRSFQTFGVAPAIDIFDPVYGADVADPTPFKDADMVQKQLGLYVQDQIDLTDKWVLSLNGRYDWATTETVDNLWGADTDQDDDAFSGRAGVVYLADNGLAPYFSYSESFLPVLGTDANGDAFVPERGKQYEAGIKYQPRGARSYVTLAVFDLTKENVLQYDPATFIPGQTGQIRSRGIELEGIASFDSGLDLIASYTLLDMEITESVNPVEVGKQPAQVPEHKLSVWADYRMANGFGIGGGVRYNGEQYGDTANTLEVPDSTLFDLAFYYDWGKYQFALNVQNVTDEEYVATCFVRGGNFCTFGQGRTIAGNLRYRW